MSKPFLFLIGRHPRLLAAALFAIGAASILGAGRIRFDSVPKHLFASDTEAFRILERVERDFSTDDNDCLVIVDAPEDLFRPTPLRGLGELLREMRGVEGVESVFSMASVPVFESGLFPRPLLPGPSATAGERRRALDRALAHPLVGGLTLSKDGRTALVVVRLAGGDLPIERTVVMLERIRAVCRTASRTGNFECYVTGVPAIRADTFATMQHDQIVISLAGAGISLLVGLVIFRSVWAMFLIAAGPVSGLLWTFGIIGAAGIELNPISSVLPTLVIVIGFTDSVHLGLDIRRQLASGRPRREAALHTVRRLALPCGVTSLTTAIGFGSLCVVDIPSIRTLGLVTGIGAVTTFFAVLTVVPFLATTFIGDRLNRTRKAGSRDENPAWHRLIDPVLRRPRAFAAAGVLLTALLGTSAAYLRPDTKLTESVPVGFESLRGLRICDRAFGGVLEAHILIEWDPSSSAGRAQVLRAIRAAEGVVEDSDAVGAALSVLDVLAALPGTSPPVERAAALPLLPEAATARFLREDRGRAIVRLRVPDRYTSETRPEFQRIASALNALDADHPGFRFSLTGPVVVIGNKVDEMIGELIKSLGVAAVVIFAVLAAMFRSIRLGLVSLLPNLFPMVVTSAVIVAAGWPLYLGNVIVFSVCLGVAVDDTVHFIAAYLRSRAAGRSRAASARRSFVRVGTALAVTTAILVAGFAATFFSRLEMLWAFGLLSCFALCAALLGDLFFLPAFLLLTDREENRPAESQRRTGANAASPSSEGKPNCSEGGASPSASGVR